MRVFLIHVRDPQFYAIAAKRRPRDARVSVMGFPPIGIMTLSAVLKRAGTSSAAERVRLDAEESAATAT